MSRIEFFLDMHEVPTVTAQQKGVTTRGWKLSKHGKLAPKICHYKKPEVAALEMKLAAGFSGYAPQEKIEGPVRLEVTFTHNWPLKLRHKRMIGEVPEWMPKTTKPDTDNMLKMVKDVLTVCRFWHDDAQVCAEFTRKGWGDRPGIHIVIQPYVPDYSIPEPEAVI